MGFEGNLSSVSFADILQLLGMGKKTGTLFIERDENRKEVCFKEGSIIWATSNNDAELLENSLLKQSKLTKDDLIKAKEVMELTSKSLPSTLVFLGLMPKEQVAEMMMKHIENLIYEVFSWEDGAFVFKDKELPDTEQVINALNTMSILMEGTRRIDEWNRIRNTLPRENTVMKVVQNGLDQNEEVRLSSSEARILSLIDGQRSIEEIKDRSPFDDLETSRSIYGLMMAGIITTSGTKESTKAKIDERKKVTQIMVRVYSATLEIVREELNQKLGKAGDRAIISAYEEAAKSHPVLENVTVSQDGKFDFVNFVTLSERLPEESRIHIMSSGLASLLDSCLEKTISSVGMRQMKASLSRIISKIGDLLTENKDLLKKFSVYEDLFRVLQIKK
ncbi:MAG TPA: DUF4388 domain-containing protein [candidate division Zixibacteria bacterium]|nr:DUF4388 domain-containing protein [candidate division Zixibacteria bacterium]